MSLTTLLPAQTTYPNSIKVKGSTQPLKRNHKLDAYEHFETTPFIGTEFTKASGVQLSQLVNASNADEYLRDLAILSESPCLNLIPFLP